PAACPALEVLAHEAEEHAVVPAAVPPVRLPLDALTDEADALGVAHRPLVEAVALELEPVVAEDVEELPLEEPSGLVGQPAAAEIRVDRQPLALRDARVTAGDMEAERPCAAPRPVLLDLDHEASEVPRLGVRALDRGENGVAIARSRGPDERLHLLVPPEPGEEVGV